MIEDAAHRITTYLREQIDDGLRTVVVLRPDRWAGIYLRSDLQETYDGGSYEDVLDTFRDGETFAFDDEIGEIGQRRALVHYYEEAFVFLFPFDDDEVILVSVEADAGRELLMFIETCRRQIYDDSEYQ